MKFARGVFYFEIFLNLLSATLSFFVPAVFAATFVPQTIPPLGLELIRWYGVLLFVFVWVMWRALRSNDDRTLSFVVEAFLIGDLVHLVACALYFRAGGAVGLGSIFMVLMTVFLASVRIYWLILYHRQSK
jgi:hypothetical protein